MISIQNMRTHTEEIINLLTKLVSIETPSTNKVAVDEFGSFIAHKLSNQEAIIEIDQQQLVGNHIIARWNRSTDTNGIFLLSHMDTVYDLGTVHQRPVRIVNNRLYGPGALDMKASIAIILYVVRWLKNNALFPARPITALFTSDEEIGSDHSKKLIQKLASLSSLTLCMEPSLPDGSLKTARKGTGDMEIVCLGKAAHAGVDHEKGRNAIEELAHQIISAQKLTDYSRGTTVSVGVVHGGTRTNVVPDQASAQVDFRIAIQDEYERLQQWAQQRIPVLDGTQVSVAIRQDRPPMERDSLMVKTFRRVQSLGQQLGLPLTEGSTGGGSDANFVAPLRIPVMDGLGAIGDGAHSEREYVNTDSLAERAALLASILMEW